MLGIDNEKKLIVFIIIAPSIIQSYFSIGNTYEIQRIVSDYCEENINLDNALIKIKPNNIHNKLKKIISKYKLNQSRNFYTILSSKRYVNNLNIKWKQYIKSSTSIHLNKLDIINYIHKSDGEKEKIKTLLD